MTKNEDHDLLIELRTEMRGVREDVKDLRDSLSTRVDRMETSKIDRTELNRLQSEALNVHVDHEKRLRDIEKYRWLMAGAILVASSVLSFVVEKVPIHLP